MKENIKIDQILSPKRLADWLRISEKNLLRWRKQGLPYLKVGHKIFFYEEDFIKWALKRRKVEERNK